MILLDDVIQILHLTQFDRRPGICLNSVDGGRVGATLADGDLVGQAVLADGAFQPIDYVYFPCDSIGSIITELEFSRTAQVGAFGSEGMTSVMTSTL